MKFFIPAIIFFMATIVILAFTIFLYINLVIAVKNNRDVPGWMYKIGRSLRGREGNAYKNFTNKSALNQVNFFIIGIVIASIGAYFLFHGKYFPNNDVAFWLYTEFIIIIVMRAILGWKFVLSFLPVFREKGYNYDLSAAANAVVGMTLMWIFTCILALNLTGLPVKAPTVQVGEYEIVIGHTTADALLSKGFSFIEESGDAKTAKDVVENKRDSHFNFGETVELVRDGKSYGYVNLTPRYKDLAELEDCIITYYGITSKSETFDSVKICDKALSQLSREYLEKEDMRDVFSLSPVSYEENKGNGFCGLKMQTYPYMLWNCYNIEAQFFSKDKSNQFEVYAQHTLWE